MIWLFSSGCTYIISMFMKRRRPANTLKMTRSEAMSGIVGLRGARLVQHKHQDHGLNLILFQIIRLELT